MQPIRRPRRDIRDGRLRRRRAGFQPGDLGHGCGPRRGPAPRSGIVLARRSTSPAPCGLAPPVRKRRSASDRTDRHGWRVRVVRNVVGGEHGNQQRRRRCRRAAALRGQLHHLPRQQPARCQRTRTVVDRRWRRRRVLPGEHWPDASARAGRRDGPQGGQVHRGADQASSRPSSKRTAAGQNARPAICAIPRSASAKAATCSD